MMKVIDLDQALTAKEGDSYVFTLTIGGERVGATDQEVADLLKAKHASAKASAKRAPQRRSAQAETAAADAGGAAEPGELAAEPVAGETAAAH